jgi:hypothetical protein
LDDLAPCEELHERLQRARLEQRSLGIAMDSLLFGHPVNKSPPFSSPRGPWSPQHQGVSSVIWLRAG